MTRDGMHPEMMADAHSHVACRTVVDVRGCAAASRAAAASAATATLRLSWLAPAAS